MKSLTPAKVTLLMFFVVGGLIATYIAKGLMASAGGQPTVEMRTIPMAISELSPGTVITEAHIGNGRYKVSEIKPGMLLSSEGVVGRVVKTKVTAATPIHSAQLFPPGERPSLTISSGMRAHTVSVGESTSMVDGLVKPGEYVDVHMTVGETGGNDPRYQGGLTLTLFKGVKVLAINQRIQSSTVDRAGNSVTLELSPRQVNIMTLAEKRGEITMVLNPEGKGFGVIDVDDEDRATFEEILGLGPASQSPFVTESYRGSDRATLQFREGRRVEAGGPAPTTGTNGNNTTHLRGKSNRLIGQSGNKRTGEPRLLSGRHLYRR